VKSKANEILTAHRNMIENQNELLSKRNNELLELDEEKNNFINILSHDLRAPINNISGLAGLLKMDENLTESQISSIEHIASESRRLNKMVTRILDVERIESNSTEDFRVIDLTEVLNKVLSNYKQQALDKKITLALDSAGEQKVSGLEQYLFHVFENLLSNAIKFSPLGEAIWIKVETENGFHQVSFTDGGPGLSEEDQKRMFKKFQRLSAKPTAGERSTGLGLSIVAKYTGLLGGKLEWESAPDQGTTFIVKLKAV
ncbi:HAMP domain-containing sensor histidine kinase, partial [Reichenbachiella sp.]